MPAAGGHPWNSIASLISARAAWPWTAIPVRRENAFAYTAISPGAVTFTPAVSSSTLTWRSSNM